MDIKTVQPIKLQENFTLEEFVCHSGNGEVYVEPVLHEALQALRDEINEWDPEFKFVITSGYRTEAYNKSIGGAEDSQHMKGRAADTESLNGLPQVLFEYYARKHGFRGGFTYVDSKTGEVLWRHLDVRDETYEEIFKVETVEKEE